MLRAVVLAVGSVFLASFAPGPTDLPGTAKASGKPVVDAVVWLDAATGTPPVHHSKPVLDQRNLSFSPHVLAVQLGTKVEFPNHDRVFHNVFSYHDGKRFDLGLYPVGAIRDVPFDQAGLSRVFCNIHSQMAAYVMVVDTPYFAVADEHGTFNVQDVLPGAYHYHAWRPGAEIVNGSVTAGPGAVLEVRWP